MRALLVPLLALTACSGGGDARPAPSTGSDAAPGGIVALVGATPAPPLATGALIGGSLADARRADPAFQPGELLLEGYQVRGTTVAGTNLVLVTDETGQQVTGVRLVSIVDDLGALLERAWGAPAVAGELPAWTDPAGRWRAELHCDASQCNVDYRRWWPVDAAFFGAPMSLPGPLAALDGKPLAAVPPADRAFEGDGMKTTAMFDGDVLVGAFVTLDARTAALLRTAWGPGTAHGDETVWLDGRGAGARC